MTRLAVLIPARNAEAHLGRLFDSLERQTTRCDEVLVYDDASTDGTGRLAAERGARVIRSDVNTGPSEGKNRLAEAARSEWIHFHDADDALHPEFARRAKAWIDRDDADVVLFATQDREDGTDRPIVDRIWDHAALKQDPVRYAIVETITNCGLYRRSAFLEAGGFDTRSLVKYNEDQAMHLRLALAGLRFTSDPLPAVVLYQRVGSMSSSHRIECARASIEVLAEAAHRTKGRYTEEIGARLWRLAGLSAGYGDWAAADRAMDLVEGIGYLVPREEHWAMRVMAAASPRVAIRVRERLIRIFKSQLRVGIPQVTGRRPGVSAEVSG